ISKCWRNFRMAVFFSPRVAPDFFRRAEGLGGTYFGEIVWKKPVGLGQRLRYSHECVALYEVGKPPQEIPYDITSIQDWSQNWAGGNGERKSLPHPHVKPVPLIEVLVAVVSGWGVPNGNSNPVSTGDVILDPFMGSGSTGIAALAQHKRFIGIESDPTHFATACRRIAAFDAQRRLF
ncbi:MAG: DNA-methyltransferase, partial [Stellaceae bacterium]